MRLRKGRDSDQPHHIAMQKRLEAQMSLQDCWRHYEKLLQQQNGVIAPRGDENAFVYGLGQFPALKRVTVTPAAHGYLSAPLYETPMIRAYPYGFNYPMLRGWPRAGDMEISGNALPWLNAKEEYKEQWHGARIALRILAQNEHNVSELSFDTKSLEAGIPLMIFDQPCEEYDHFVAIMKRPGFTHLDLPLLVGRDVVDEEEEEEDWAGLRSGNLYRALSEAKDLKHISISTTINQDLCDEPILLRRVFPVEHWPNLRHFALFRFNITQSDLLDLHDSLPSTLRSVELSFLLLCGNKSRWGDLMESMREELDWSERTTKPTVCFVVGSMQYQLFGRGMWLTDEVNDFLYRSGRNPIPGKYPFHIKYGMGEIRDPFDPEHTRPNVSPRDLSELGIIA